MWRRSSGLQDENYKSENGHGVSSLAADSTAALAAPPLLALFLLKLLLCHGVFAEQRSSLV